jgi:hypothetical protein
MVRTYSSTIISDAVAYVRLCFSVGRLFINDSTRMVRTVVRPRLPGTIGTHVGTVVERTHGCADTVDSGDFGRGR